VDRDADRIAGLEERRMPFYEPGLDEIVAEGVRRENLRFSTELPGVVRGSDVIFIAVDTPQAEDGAADLGNVAAVARGIGRALADPETERRRPLVVVNKSTVPVGSGEWVSALVEEGAAEVRDGSAVEFLVVSNPEFLRQGSAVYDSMFPDRIVAGAESGEALDTMRALYEPIIEQTFPAPVRPRPKSTVPFLATSLSSAEMIKYASNAFLATKISFINEISAVCESVGADVTSVAHGIGLDERIGGRFLNAGLGWGGSCFPKDISALRAVAREHDHKPALLDAVVSVNERQLERVVTWLRRDLEPLEGKRIALLGLAFKPETDDLRGAPSLKIARDLGSLSARVVGYDPVAGKKALGLPLPNLEISFDRYEALEGAHAAIVVTDWEEVRTLDLGRAASLMQPPKLLVDGRNVLDPGAAATAGLLYRGIGRL
jgi:UDPglucose 6-dehydrogenase